MEPARIARIADLGGRKLDLPADVLHARGPNVPVVPAVVVDTGHGKRQAHADSTDPDSLAALRQVALDADVVVQGDRPGVVAGYGLGEDSLRADGLYALVEELRAVAPAHRSATCDRGRPFGRWLRDLRGADHADRSRLRPRRQPRRCRVRRQVPTGLITVTASSGGRR